jgi:hypothetical protein
MLIYQVELKDQLLEVDCYYVSLLLLPLLLRQRMQSFFLMQL